MWSLTQEQLLIKKGINVLNILSSFIELLIFLDGLFQWLISYLYFYELLNF